MVCLFFFFVSGDLGGLFRVMTDRYQGLDLNVIITDQGAGSDFLFDFSFDLMRRGLELGEISSGVSGEM